MLKETTKQNLDWGRASAVHLLTDQSIQETEWVAGMDLVGGAKGIGCPLYHENSPQSYFFSTNMRSPSFSLQALLSPHPEAHFLLRVQGDFLIPFNIFPGDTLLIEPGRSAHKERPVIIEEGGVLKLKKLCIQSQALWLEGLYPEEGIRPLTRNISFFGSVVCVIRSFLTDPISQQSPRGVVKMSL